ncbi:MAG: hypothetical protein FWC89_04115 [Defluviitaleaceae bacterium]|nr:hypothetical protein [Defluviitaleaceae bacterium]
MGAWGTAIFSDDYACDIRDSYVEQIAKGKTSEEATAIVKNTLFPADLNDDELPVFWMSLAVTQWKKGRLLQEVKDSAIAVIESGRDLLRWESASKKDIEKRRNELEKAKQLLLSPMPPAKKIPIPSWMKDDPWKLGDLISYKIIGKGIEYSEYIGKYIVLRVAETGTLQEGGAKRNFYAVYCWCGNGIPEDLTDIKAKRYIKLREGNKYYFNRQYISLEKRDIKEHEMKVLESDSNFNLDDDEGLKDGKCYGGLSGSTVFDIDISQALHNAGQKG